MGTTDGTATVETTDPKRHEFVCGLRDLADFLDEHPEVEVPVGDYYGLTLHWWQADAAGLAEAARSLGKAEKRADENFLSLVRRFGPHTVEAYVSHAEVCERVVVGTETVTVPAVEAKPERIEEREIVEWICPESILAGAER